MQSFVGSSASAQGEAMNIHSARRVRGRESAAAGSDVVGNV
ncbi:hypothetical protein Pd630_LPD04308 [Rhodococcus opacus PD630]|nr:hypothetical protein Pd630_LPD04308 [Rhodococcus opacus PD630]